MCVVGVACVAVPRSALSLLLQTSGFWPPDTTVPRVASTTPILIAATGAPVPNWILLLWLAALTMTARLSTPRQTPSPFVIILHVQVVHFT